MPESQHRPLGMPGSSWPISSIMDAKLMEWGCPWGLGPPVPVGSERPGHTASESAAVSKVSSGTTKSRAMAVLEVWLRNLPVTFGYLVLPRFCIIWESLFIFLVTRLSVLSLGTLFYYFLLLLFIIYHFLPSDNHNPQLMVLIIILCSRLKELASSSSAWLPSWSLCRMTECPLPQLTLLVLMT